jgi:hypothetical protein
MEHDRPSNRSKDSHQPAKVKPARSATLSESDESNGLSQAIATNSGPAAPASLVDGVDDNH